MQTQEIILFTQWQFFMGKLCKHKMSYYIHSGSFLWESIPTQKVIQYTHWQYSQELMQTQEVILFTQWQFFMGKLCKPEKSCYTHTGIFLWEPLQTQGITLYRHWQFTWEPMETQIILYTLWKYFMATHGNSNNTSILYENTHKPKPIIHKDTGTFLMGNRTNPRKSTIETLVVFLLRSAESQKMIYANWFPYEN